MTIQSSTGADVLKINDRIITDLIDGDTITVEFPNDIGAIKTGKNGNSIAAFNATGQNVRLNFRLVIGSSDDKFMNSLLQEWIKDPSAFTFITSQYTKRSGDGSGNVTDNVYNLIGGIFLKTPEAKTNVEGDTEQSVVTYNLTFANGIRQLT